MVPVEYHPSPAGCWEHGERLRQLWATYPGDFGETCEFPRAAPQPCWVDADGRYEELRRDEWGVLWRHLIFGVAGHPAERPLDDWANLASYRAPEAPTLAGAEFDDECRRAQAHMMRHFLKSGWISLFEVMHAVRRFEDVLMDLGSDSPRIHRLADLVAGYQAKVIAYLLARGVDAVQFGDDFGTQETMMLSPRLWRRFFRPRYERLMAPIRAAGKRIFFHTCGCGWPLLEDLAEIGVDAIWPQLNAYGEGKLAEFCRRQRIAIALHPDRGDLMTRGTPAEVQRAVGRLAEEFQVAAGGAWFYVEIDAGFPFDNVQALIGSIGRLRGC